MAAVLLDNKVSRIDSTYFRKPFLEVDRIIKAGRHMKVSDVASSVASFGAYALTNNFEYRDEGIPFLRCLNIKDGFVSVADCLFIDEQAHALLHRSAVTPGMVLLTMSGSVGNAAVALPEWSYPMNSNQDIAKITPASVDPYYLAAFLRSRFGQLQMERMPVGSVQQHIFIWMIEDMLVTRLSGSIEGKIGEIIKAAYILRENSLRHTERAEQDLLLNLGLANWSPPEPLSYTANSTIAFASGRLDSQFYRPKYDDILVKIRSAGRTIELGKALLINSRGRQPSYADDGLPVINSKHVRVNRVELDDDNRYAVVEPSSVVIQQGDVLLNGTGVGTIGRTAPYLREQPALPDNHVTVLRATGIDPVYLSVFLNSLPGQLQIEQLIKGSSGQIELYPDDIATIIVWDAPKKTQQKVRDQVLAAFAEEHRAKSLLDAAKLAVEIAIEDSEKAALLYLKDVGV